MGERANQLNNTIVDIILRLIKEQNKTNEEFISEITTKTFITESRITRILDKTAKRAITIKELFYISLILNVDIPTILKEID